MGRYIVKELNFEDTVIEDTITKDQFNEHGTVEILNNQAATIDFLNENVGGKLWNILCILTIVAVAF